MGLFGIILVFLISLFISSLIIYLATKLFREEEGFGSAILAALAGAIIFTVANYLIGIGWLAALIGGIAWLIALGLIYKIGWLKSLLIAGLVWIISTVVSLVLPTIVGPL